MDKGVFQVKFNLDSAGHYKLPKKYIDKIQKLDLKYNVVKQKRAYVGYQGVYEYFYTIEIDTLKELINLSRSLEHPLIVSKNNITILDGYID